MSTYCKKLINPNTGKMQGALCLDDFWENHKYGYCFKKNGEDYDIYNGRVEDCDIFTDKEMEKVNKLK